VGVYKRSLSAHIKDLYQTSKRPKKGMFIRILLLAIIGMFTDGFITHRVDIHYGVNHPPLRAAPEGMKWFVKIETFAKPYPQVKHYLEQHRGWVRSIRENGHIKIASGYRVDGNDKPGGGGLVSAQLMCCLKKLIRVLS
jgi:hypothetical protein